VISPLSRWWKKSSHYDWLSGYLNARGMSGWARAMLALIAAAMTLSLLALLFGSDGPTSTVGRTMTWIAVGGGVVTTLLWLRRWPTRVQSIAFGLITNTSIALACLAHPSPLPALIGCIAFATSGAYIAFFHTTIFVVYNFTVAAGVALYESIRLAATGHPALAVVDFFLIIQINIALPLAIHSLVTALGVDMLRADRDPLTGLLNRRAFQHRVLGLLMGHRVIDEYLVIAMIDLDDFKSLNDTHGHSAGDRALVEVANALRNSIGDRAVLARSGGEEFLVADTTSNDDLGPQARRLCQAIAALPLGITASVGTACAPLVDLHEDRHQSLIDSLITAADSAMYHAKRSGGNRFHHYQRG
jgi:diguanylate cyclase (GGDEF)-like protein